MIAKAMDWTWPVDLIIVIRPTDAPGEFASLEIELTTLLDKAKELIN